MEAYEVRMINELYQLDAKLAKLNAFLSNAEENPKDTPMTLEEYELVKEQRGGMMLYAEALRKRCELHHLTTRGRDDAKETIIR